MFHFKNEIQFFNELKRLYKKCLKSEEVNEEFLLLLVELILSKDKSFTKSKKLRLLDKYFLNESKNLNLKYNDKTQLNLFKSKCIDYLKSVENGKRISF